MRGFLILGLQSLDRCEEILVYFYNFPFLVVNIVTYTKVLYKRNKD